MSKERNINKYYLHLKFVTDRSLFNNLREDKQNNYDIYLLINLLLKTNKEINNIELTTFCNTRRARIAVVYYLLMDHDPKIYSGYGCLSTVILKPRSKNGRPSVIFYSPFSSDKGIIVPCKPRYVPPNKSLLSLSRV